MRKILLVDLSACVLLAARRPLSPRPPLAPDADDWIMYVGTYTRAPSKGIYAYRFQGATGAVTPIGTAGLAAETENPSFLAVHPNQRFLYAVNEVSRYEGREARQRQRLRDRPRHRHADAAEPRLVTRRRVRATSQLDRSGKWLFVANYGGGSVAAFPVQRRREAGRGVGVLSARRREREQGRQSGPHAHADGRVA